MTVIGSPGRVEVVAVATAAASVVEVVEVAAALVAPGVAAPTRAAAAEAE